MKTTAVQARLPEKLKRDVERILESMGVDLSTAIRIFFKKIAKTRTFPFSLTSDDEDRAYCRWLAEQSLKQFWSDPKDDLWDTYYQKTPSLR